MARDLYDVAVVGAGVAGVTAATRLALDGHGVLLIAAQRRHPREFRAEKFGVHEAELLGRLGLWNAARDARTSFDEVLVGQWGRPVERVAMREYSTRYPDFVDALRAGVPDRVDGEVGRVARIEGGADTQEIVLADGRRARARLVVLATGLIDGLRRELGIGKEVVSRAHSLVYGFDLARPPTGVPFQSLTWRGERFGDGIAYLTLFPLGGTLRANLFTHWDPSGLNAQASARDPAGELAARLPGFTRFCGRIAVAGAVEQRTVDLLAATTYRRDGVVLVGDAFCTSCPSTGTGIRKVLTDVDRLVAHVPGWLATPGMAADKIAAFYADPVKTACDRESVRLSLIGRHMLVDRSPAWQFRRLRSFVYRRGRHELGRLQARSGVLAAQILPGA